MGGLSELNSVVQAESRAATRRQHPDGFEPGVAWSNERQSGSVTTGPLEDWPDPELWAEIVRDWGLDPNIVTIDPRSVEVRAWDAAIGKGQTKRLKYYKAKLIPAGSLETVDRPDVDALCAAIMKRRPRKTVAPAATDRAAIALLSDWQMGKGEGGGSSATVERIQSALDKFVEYVREMRRIGRPLSRIVLAGLGDLVEQCMGHYANQLFTVDLNRREQMRVVRRLIIQYVDALVDLVPEIVLVAVAGNHGEYRNSKGKVVTTPDDNDDLAVFEQAAEVFAANPARYGGVSVVLAKELAMTLDVFGVVVGFTHMHQGSKGSTPQQKVENWWKGQALGRDDSGVGEAEILFTGHYHHLTVIETFGRTWFQTPSMDGGSRWFRDTTGQHSESGMLVVTVGDVYRETHRRPWGDMAVLS